MVILLVSFTKKRTRKKKITKKIYCIESLFFLFLFFGHFLFNTISYKYTFLCFFFCSLFFLQPTFHVFQGTISYLTEVASPRASALTKRTDELKDWMSVRRLPRKTRYQIISHMKYGKYSKRRRSNVFIVIVILIS